MYGEGIEAIDRIDAIDRIEGIDRIDDIDEIEMAYESSMRDKRICILAPEAPTEGDMGMGSNGDTYCPVKEIWASVKWNKGMKAMNEGAMEAYDYIMVRTAWTPCLTRECRIRYQCRDYRIESFYADYQADEIQITAVELAV